MAVFLTFVAFTGDIFFSICINIRLHLLSTLITDQLATTTIFFRKEPLYNIYSVTYVRGKIHTLYLKVPFYTVAYHFDLL